VTTSQPSHFAHFQTLKWTFLETLIFFCSKRHLFSLYLFNIFETYTYRIYWKKAYISGFWNFPATSKNTGRSVSKWVPAFWSYPQVHNFDLSNYFRFFLLLREMSRETVQKHVVQKPNTSRPFYLWLILLKIFTALNSTNKFTTLILSPLPSTTNSNQGYLEEKNCFLSISNWPMLYCNLKNWGGLFMSLKDKFFFIVAALFCYLWL